MLGEFQNLSLRPCLFQMLLVNEVLFPHGLNSVVLGCALQLAKHNFSKGSLSEHLQQLKLMEVCNIRGGARAFED